MNSSTATRSLTSRDTLLINQRSRKSLNVEPVTHFLLLLEPFWIFRDSSWRKMLNPRIWESLRFRQRSWSLLWATAYTWPIIFCNDLRCKNHFFALKSRFLVGRHQFHRPTDSNSWHHEEIPIDHCSHIANMPKTTFQHSWVPTWSKKWAISHNTSFQSIEIYLLML